MARAALVRPWWKGWRRLERAANAAAVAASQVDNAVPVEGARNEAAVAAADIIVLAVLARGHAETLRGDRRLHPGQGGGGYLCLPPS